MFIHCLQSSMCFAESKKRTSSGSTTPEVTALTTLPKDDEDVEKSAWTTDLEIKIEEKPKSDPLTKDKWGWVILMSTFFNYMVVSAIWYSFSVLYKEFADHFDMSLASIGALASIEAAALHFTGAMCSGLVEKYGSRPVAMTGSFIASVALFGGAFVNDIVSLYIIYGIAGGGIGLSYISFVVITQKYFEKQRTIASGFSLTGFSIASFSLPPFTRWLLDLYGWRGTLMMISGIYLNGVLLAALLRPREKRIRKPRGRRRTTSLSERVTRQLSIERTKSRMSKIYGVIRKVFDYRMFRYPTFVLYGFGTFFMMVGNIGFFMHLVNRARSLGIEKHMATFLPSIYGIANGVCRLLFSVAASMPQCNRILQYGVWILFAGLISCLSGLATNFIGLAICCAGFGMCVGAFICIQYPALVDLLGVKTIAKSTGLLQIFIGAAGLIATPMTGYIYDVTANYDIPYYVMGSIMMLGGAIILIIPCLQPHDHGHAQQSQCCTRGTGQEIGDVEEGVTRDESLEESITMSTPDHEDEEDTEEQTSCQSRMRELSASSHLSARS